MNIFIKESLYLLDYNDNILDVLFLSTDKDTPGQAYEINIKENNTGYSDLTFKMPSFIVNEEGEKVVNPKLTLIEGKRISAGKQKNDGLVPLSKVRYNRVVRYMGEEIINFPGPDGTTVQYPKNNGENPEDYIIEDYVMDYIIQPLDKNRQSLKIDLTYTAIDFPRFNLSKKKLGFTIDDTTLTTPELSIWDNKPTSIPGSIQYIPWSEALAQQFQSANSVTHSSDLSGVKQPVKGEVYYVYEGEDAGYYQYNGEGWDKKTTADFVTWEPNPQSGGYPLDDNSIKKLVSQTKFTNGVLATIYYWPVVIPSYTTPTGEEQERKTARFEGVTYEKGSFITLSLYNLYEGLELKYKSSQKVGDIAWDWNYLEPNQLYLNPNNACNLLRYILKNTNWNVANDGGAFFIRNETSPNTPWFEPGSSPASGEDGQYYIIRNSEPESGIRPYTYTIMQYVNGRPTDMTKQLLPIVNTDENDLGNFGIKYDVFIEPKEVSRTAEGTLGQIETMDSQYSLNISNANCYNAITEEAKLFNLYPVFDCINKTVALKEHAGADYGLTYRAGRNLKTSTIKLDGEKVITKLYVTGGTDAQGSANINIGEAVRVINGVTPELTSPNLNRYAQAPGDQDIFNNMKAIQSKAYDLITGSTITNNLNLANQELVLDFPDNFYTYFFSSDADKLQDIAPVKLMGTGSGANELNVWLRYQGVDNTHCFYIYVAKDSSDYLDEKKQLYKADCTNIKVRRNLQTFKPTNADFGVVSKAPTTEVINGYSTNYAQYIKYRETIEDGAEITSGSHNYLYQEGIGYRGYNITLDNSGYYQVEEPFNTTDSFVLAGPTRVYKFDADNALTQINTTFFTPGNYYYTEENDSKRYYYCALQNELQDVSSSLPYYDNSALNKMNTIIVGNYVFLSLGDGSAPVSILNNGITYTVTDLDGNTITLSDWLINNYALRVKVNTTNNTLEETYVGDEWDPNAEEYLVGRSPYGTSYIYNFKYLYDNEWMTREQILDIYSKSYEINAINIEFFNKYNKALEAARKAYWDAINNLELYESKGDAQLETLMSQYWKNPAKASDDKFSAFPYMPAGSGISYNETKHMYTTNIDYEGENVKQVYFNIYNTAGCNYLYPSSVDAPASASNPETEGQYHVVAKALGWETYKANHLPINSTFTKPENVVDASDTVSNYNKIIENMKLYYWKAKMAGSTMDEALTEVERLEALFNEWQESLNIIERYLQENYGQYIIEGSYSNDEQPYANLLLQDGLKASDEYAIPQVTYGVNVVDASGMIEYRAPQNLIANDLVKKLHSLGQIVPKVGDYVAIFDDSMGLIKVGGLITSINRRIDDPYQNALTIDTSYTDADELVGQIITATNTVLNNKDIYGRAAALGPNGELSTDAVNGALNTGKNSLSITSTNGKVVVDDNGLTATNPDNNQKLMRYNGTGVLGSSDGGITWRELMSQEGINANHIVAGTVNTQKVSVSNGQYDTVILDGNGLTVKQRGGSNYTLGHADLTTGQIVWPQNSNVAVFVGKDENNTGIGYFDGYIKASKGGEIGGWTIGTDRLYSGSGDTYTALSSGTTYAFWSGAENASNAPVSITHSGILNSSNINITGGSLKIGSDSANPNFQVTSAGVLTAKSANINGTIVTNNITATGGKIGGWTIGSDRISQTHGVYKVTLANYDNDNAGSRILHCSVNGTDTFYVHRDGKLYCSNADISGKITATSGSFTGSIHTSSGEIGGLNISSSGLSNSHASIQSNGAVNFHPQVGSGGDYIFNNGMDLHSTSSQKIRSGSTINLGNGETPTIVIKSTSGGSVEIHAYNLRINATNMSVGNSYDGTRTNARTATITIPASGSISGQTLKFINGILVS